MTQSSSLDEPCTDSAPMPCEHVGMAWWNGLTEADRRYWCFAATTAVPAETWRYFKSVTRDDEKSKVVCMT